MSVFTRSPQFKASEILAYFLAYTQTQSGCHKLMTPKSNILHSEKYN